MATSKGYPFARVVMGHIIANPVLRLYSLGDITKAGRWPACFRPVLGGEVQPNDISAIRGIFHELPNFFPDPMASLGFPMKVFRLYIRQKFFQRRFGFRRPDK